VVNEQRQIEATGFFDKHWQELVEKWSRVTDQDNPLILP
jgi:hypothetical protein